MEKSLYQDRVTGELIPEEIKITLPKRGLNLDLQWYGEKKKLKRRETVQPVDEEDLALELAGAPKEDETKIARKHYKKWEKVEIEARAKKEKIKNDFNLVTGHYSRLEYLLAIPRLKKNLKFLAFLDWHDQHCIRGKEQEILDQQWVCVQGKKKSSLIFHRMKKADYKPLERQTGVTPRLARRYVQLAVATGIWQTLGDLPKHGGDRRVYTSGYFAKFKDPKTGKEGYKKIRWLKKSDKEMIHALQNFKVRL